MRFNITIVLIFYKFTSFTPLGCITLSKTLLLFVAVLENIGFSWFVTDYSIVLTFKIKLKTIGGLGSVIPCNFTIAMVPLSDFKHRRTNVIPCVLTTRCYNFLR